jgi:subtilase family serine protease
VGGTSVSVQLLSGLLALVAESVKGHLGLINPFLYSLGNNPSTYTEAFTPVTFGYTIPWTASYGYNLATGWGAPNVGEIASLYNATKTQSSLSISVDLTNSVGGAQEEFTSGQVVYVTANVTSQGAAVTSGEFTASLVTLEGASMPTFMTYNSTEAVWTASLTMGQQSGIAYVDVNGVVAGLSGDGFAEIFAGYLASFLSPIPIAPWTTQSGGIEVVVASTDLNGNPAPLQPLTMQVDSYSILNNLYNPVDTVTLQPAYIPSVGNVTAAILTSSYPTGPIDLVLQGSVYGFLPFMNGIYLQTTLILPEVAVEPGSVAPGQSLIIVAFPIAPLNVAETASMETGATVGSDVATGSNVTALLVNPSGATVGEAALLYQSSEIIGYLAVPYTAMPGLYTILLEASYSSVTLGYTLEGSFYGQILVSSGTITPLVTLSPSTMYMGQTAQITADIAYPNGQEVTQGEYTALIYPEELQNEYIAIMYAEYLNGELTPLSYNSTLNRWVGDVTLPSSYNSGVISPVTDNSFYYAGPYDAYVTGLSYDGVPTVSAMSAQQGFFIQPYVYVSNQEVTSFQQSWGLALSGVTVVGSANLDEDVFLDSNWFNSGTFVVSDSMVSGTVYVSASTLTLVGVHGGNVVASDSTINLVNTNLDSINLVNSQVSLTSSSYQSITPSPPTVQILSPVNGGNYTGNVNGSLNVSGDSIGSVVVCLDGQPIQTFSQNGTLSFTIPSAEYPDGAYSLEAVVTQTDGINSTATSTVYFQNQLSQITSLVNSLNSTRTSLQNQITSLMNSLNTANDYAYAGIGVGVAAVAIAIVTLLRKRPKRSAQEEPKSAESPQENSEQDLTLQEGSVT